MGYLFSAPYKKAVERIIGHQFERRIEKLRADLRDREQLLRAEIQRRDGEIAALRGGALAGLASRQSALSQKRIDAVECVWRAVIGMGPYKTVATWVSHLDAEEMIRQAASRTPDAEKFKTTGQMLWQASGAERVKYDPRPEEVRPFVPPLAWAYYEAYKAMLNYPALQLTMIRMGGGDLLQKRPDSIISAAKAALPERADYIDQYGAATFPFLTDELERKLLSALTEALFQSDVDNRAVDDAARILAAAEEATSKEPPALPAETPRAQPVPAPAQGG